MKQRSNSQSRDLTGNLGDPDWTTDLVGTCTAGEDVPDIRERLVDPNPGLLDAKPECGRGVDTLGRHFAGGGLAGNAQHAKLVDVSERVFHFLEFRRALQLQGGIAALDRERERLTGSRAHH